MKRALYLVVLLLAALPLSAQMAVFVAPQSTMRNIPVSASTLSCGAATGYTSTFTVTISAQTGQSGNLSNWPIIIQGSTIFATTANPPGLSQSSGLDVVFCNAGVVLPYYFVSGTYSATTGAGYWVVQAPFVSNSVSVTIRGVVGKASASDLSCGSGGTNNCGSTLFSNNWVMRQDYGAFVGGTTNLIASQMADETLRYTSPTNNFNTSGGVKSVSGEIFGGANFAGGIGQNWIDMGGTVPALTAFSLEGWIQNTSVSQEFVASNRNAAQTGGAINFGVTGSGGSNCAGTSNWCFDAIFTDSSGNLTCTFSTNTTSTSLHHIVITHAAGSNVMTLYNNGVLDSGAHTNNCASGSVGAGINPGTSASDLQIGRLGDNASSYYVLIEDELALTSFQMTADEALFDYNNQSNPSSTYTVTTP